MSDESLGAILGGSSAFHEQPKAEPAQVAAAAEPVKVEPSESAEPVKASQPRDEVGKFAKPEPEVKAEPEPVEAKPEAKAKTPDSALAEMSRRLRAAEARVREYESQREQKPVPSVFEDEDSAIRSRVTQETSPLRAVLLDQSVELAKLRHSDSWNEAESAFYEAVEANPALVDQFRNAINPGEFAYQHGMNHKVMSQYGGNVVAMREAIQKEGQAKLTEAQTRIKALEAEMQALKASKAEAESLPKSLNNRSSAPVGETPADAEDITQIVRFGKTG